MKALRLLAILCNDNPAYSFVQKRAGAHVRITGGASEDFGILPETIVSAFFKYTRPISLSAGWVHEKAVSLLKRGF